MHDLGKAMAAWSCSQLLSCGLPQEEEVEAASSSKKRKRDDEKVAEGAAAARAFLSEFAALPLDALAPEEAVTKAQELYKKLDESAKSSPYLAGLIAEA